MKVDEDDWIETCKRFARSFCSITVQLPFAGSFDFAAGRRSTWILSTK